MNKILSLLSVLFLALALTWAEKPAAEASSDKTVGIDVPFEDISDFYYTYDASTAPPHYQRYRFYTEDGKAAAGLRLRRISPVPARQS